MTRKWSAVTTRIDTKPEGLMMHQVVLITALTAASGLFGGGRHCSSGRCGQSYSYAPAPCAAQAGCYPHQSPAQYAAPYGQAPYGQAPQAAYYQSQYYAPAAAPCATGNCPRR